MALGAVLCLTLVVTAQPGPDRRTFYRTQVQHNPDVNEQRRAIAELRRQLPDTADPVNTLQRHPTRMKLQREALFLNFLCYLHEAQLGALNACVVEQGLKNYAHLVALGAWEGYPSPEEQQEAHTQAKDLQHIICYQMFEQNSNRLEDIPTEACGCTAVINEMLAQADEQRRAEEADRSTYREAARKDSIGRVEAARNAELSMAIYAPDGRLRIDTNTRLATAAIDSLNGALCSAMVEAASSVFHTGPHTGRDWELLASIIQEGRPLVWVQQARKKGSLFEFEGVVTGDPGGNIRLKLLSELHLHKVARFVKDGEVLVVPYRVLIDPTLSGSNVRMDASDGYVNILLRPIPEVRRD
jgi:hypothetical protein